MKSALKIMATLVMFVALFAGCGAKPDWQEYKSEEAGFSVMMPGKDVEVQSSSTSTAAGPIMIHMYSVSLSKAYYMVAYNEMSFLEGIELTDSDKDDILEGGVEGAIGTFPDGEFVYRRDITLRGHPGKEYRADGTKNGMEMVVFGKAYLVGTRLYQVMATTTKSDANDENIKKFMDSFKLL